MLQGKIDQQTQRRKNPLDLNTYMKGMRLANVTIDFPKEWTHTRFVMSHPTYSCYRYTRS